MKILLKMAAWFVALIVLMLSCSNPVNTMSSPIGAKPMEDKEFYQITNGVFLGGGLFYNETNSNLNHFSQLQSIPVRLAKLSVTNETEEVYEDVLDAQGNVVSSQKVTETKPKYQDIPESVLVGSLEIQSISDSEIIFDFELMNTEKLVQYRREGADIKVGETIDLNDDGLADLSYRRFSTEPRAGYEGTLELAFLSSKENLHTTMHKSPDDPEFKFPSGIVTVNPSGRVIIDSNNFTVLSKSEGTMVIEGENIPDVVKGDFIIDSEDKSIRVIESKSINSSQMHLTTRVIPSFMAYEVMNLGIKGNLDSVTRRYINTTDSRALSSRAYNLSLLNQEGTLNMPIPQGWSGYANLEYAVGLSIEVDAGTSFNWDEAGAFASFKVNSNAKIIFDALIAASWTKDFSKVIAQPEFNFFIGPVPVSLGATLLIGTEVEFNAAGRLRMGGSFRSTLGAEAGARIWVDWDWFNTKVKSRAWMNPINVFETEIIEPVLEMTGQATLRPYLEIQPFFMVARVATVYVKLRTYVEGSASVSLSNDSSTTADIRLDLGVKGMDPSLFLGVDILGYRLGKDFTFSSTFFDLKKNIYNQPMTFAKPPKPLTNPPVFSQPGGSYLDSISIALSTTTEGADIRYTIDGSDPNAYTGILYTGPILISSPTTLKAIAFKFAHEVSPTVTQTFNILKFVEPPLYSLESGIYTSVQTLVLSTSTPGASLRYTIDGSDPTPTSGMVYGGPITVDKSMDIRALGYRDGWTSSDVVSRVYTITGTVATPQIYPSADGFFYSPQEITLETATPDSKIWYTLDGSTPGPLDGLLYTGPFVLNASANIRAMATRTNWLASSESAQTYTITGTVSAPVISQASGTYTQSSLSIALTSSTPGAQIRYTLDGSTPTTTQGTLYSSPLSLTSSSNLKAFAYKTGWLSSNVTSAVYTLRAPAPSFTLPNGYYTTAQELSINVPTGLQVRYTTDGSLPSSTEGTLYTGGTISIPYGQAMDVKAIAFRAGLQDSSVIMGSYATGVLGAPAFSLSPEIYHNDQTLSLTSFPSGASIRYTTNGVDPTSSSGTLYSGPIALTGTTTVKAIAYNDGYPDSSVATASYTLKAGTVDSNFGDGLLTGPSQVQLTTVTDGAQIKYTLDGSIPSTVHGLIYAGPIPVSKNTILKAVAVKSAYSDSEVSEWNYLIQAVAPSFGVQSDTYESNCEVTMTAAAGLSIRYTLDGSVPSSTHGIVYSGALNLTSSSTVKAVAYSSEYAESNVVSSTYTIKAKSPTFSHLEGTYGSNISLTLASETPGTEIRYTVDGSEPSASSTLYTSAITVDRNRTIKAIAVKPGVTDSEVVTRSFNFNVASPVFGVVAGTYTNSVAVTLASDTEGASIRYTTDGSDPSSTTGTVYSGAFTLTQTTSIKAIAYRDGWVSSSISSRTYTLKVANPTASVAGGTYSIPVNVMFSSITPGVIIRYTTDGTSPTVNNGIVLTGSLTVTESKTIKLIAFKSGLEASDVVTYTYTMLPWEIGKISITGARTDGGAENNTLNWLQLDTSNSSSPSGLATISQALRIDINVEKSLAYNVVAGKYLILTGVNEGSVPIARTFVFTSDDGAWSQSITVAATSVDHILRNNFPNTTDNYGYVEFYFDGHTVTWTQK